MDYDVIVAGAGPVGLMLACELRLGGARVLVLERLTEIDQTIKAGAITAPSAEALYRRGFQPAIEREQRATLERFFGAVGPGDEPPKVPRVGGHFGAIWLDADRIDDSDPDFAGHGPVEGITMVNQQQVEAMLGGRAAELGVELRRGTELAAFTADADRVTVTAGGQRLTAGWLVGCDGGRSTVRKLAGFDFPGTDPEITAHQAIVELAGADGLNRGWNVTDRGVYVHGPGPRILTVEFDGTPDDRDAPVTAEELQASLRAVSGVDVTITAVRSATRFTDNARQVPEYRKGRVLLAGDAAHVHSPFGGQGLSLGIGDAMNLGWKLAAVVRGWAPDGLLDTYTAERHPIGAWVLDWTRAQVAAMRPEPKARALRAVFTELANTAPGTTYLAKRIAGLWQSYDLGGGHELVGRSAPDLAFDGGGRLAERLADGHGLLVDLGEHGKLRELGGRWSGRVRVLAERCADRPGLSALLVRPDGFVAWAADGEPDLDSAEAALCGWFGEA